MSIWTSIGRRLSLPRSGPRREAPLGPPFATGPDHLEVAPSFVRGKTLVVTMANGGNRLDVAHPFSVGCLTVSMDGGASVRIGPNCVLGHLRIHAGPGARIEIDGDVGFNGAVKLLAHEAYRIAIGRGSLIADNVMITASDIHSILDARTGRRINPGGSIVLSESVWVGEHATVLKGVTLGANAVVATRSVVTRDVPSGCVAAGSPARIVRTGVRWSPELL